MSNDFSINISQQIDHFALSSSIFFFFFYWSFCININSWISIFQYTFGSWTSGWFNFNDRSLDWFFTGLFDLFLIKFDFSECSHILFFGVLFANICWCKWFVIFWIVFRCLILNCNITGNCYSALSGLWFEHNWNWFSIN